MTTAVTYFGGLAALALGAAYFSPLIAAIILIIGGAFSFFAALR